MALKDEFPAFGIACMAEGLTWPMTGFLYLDKYNFYKVLVEWDSFSGQNIFLQNEV